MENGFYLFINNLVVKFSWSVYFVKKGEGNWGRKSFMWRVITIVIYVITLNQWVFFTTHNMLKLDMVVLDRLVTTLNTDQENVAKD